MPIDHTTGLFVITFTSASPPYVFELLTNFPKSSVPLSKMLETKNNNVNIKINVFVLLFGNTVLCLRTTIIAVRLATLQQTVLSYVRFMQKYHVSHDYLVSNSVAIFFYRWQLTTMSI